MIVTNGLFLSDKQWKWQRHHANRKAQAVVFDEQPDKMIPMLGCKNNDKPKNSRKGLLFLLYQRFLILVDQFHPAKNFSRSWSISFFGVNASRPPLVYCAALRVVLSTTLLVFVRASYDWPRTEDLRQTVEGINHPRYRGLFPRYHGDCRYHTNMITTIIFVITFLW